MIKEDTSNKVVNLIDKVHIDAILGENYMKLEQNMRSWKWVMSEVTLEERSAFSKIGRQEKMVMAWYSVMPSSV